MNETEADKQDVISGKAEYKFQDMDRIRINNILASRRGDLDLVRKKKKKKRVKHSRDLSSLEATYLQTQRNPLARKLVVRNIGITGVFGNGGEYGFGEFAWVCIAQR